MKLVIVGGVAGGASAAARARRLSEDAEIILFERGPDVSFANCGLPYYVGGEIAERNKLLVTTPEQLRTRFELDVRTRSSVESIDRTTKKVHVRDLASGREYEESYDKLILAPGAAPLRPPLPGIDLPGIFTLRNLQDVDRIKQRVDQGVKQAVDRNIAAYCQVGQRGYLATRILRQKGFSASNVGGGYKTYKLFQPTAK
jgi:NADPH-dependent 2,4-dienoyl-CoA reductase/sulfur reductase-like enzyme